MNDLVSNVMLINLACIHSVLHSKKLSCYDQEIPQSQTTDQPKAPIGRNIEHNTVLGKKCQCKIVNIFLPMVFRICFGYSKEPSH